MSRYSIAPVRMADLADALAGGATLVGDAGTVVRGITQDSREVEPGDLYCCVVGASHDGHSFVPEAIARGAAAVLCQRGRRNEPVRIDVDDVRAVLGRIADRAFGSPARRLRMVGVTGTNGKTSTVGILGSIVAASGSRVRTIGTLTGQRTTPEAIDLHAALAGAVADGIDTVVMEVSSHALDQRRVDGIVFDVAVFTNLGRDHLDYHGTMEAYFAAKARLFGSELAKCAVVNLDDPYGRRLSDVQQVPVRGFSRTEVSDVRVSVDRVSFRWKGVPIEVPMGGSFTIDNALAAASAAEVLGVPLAQVVEGCADVHPIKGRFESIVSPEGFAVVVDYAHTPEALESLLRSARSVTDSRLIVVFGCGGGRDAGKRPLMGRVAATLSDMVVVTSDNPRHEHPAAIIADIVSGAAGGASQVEIEPDRAAAIAAAVASARAGDTVVIAGKGHETVQEIGNECIRFDDMAVATASIERRQQARHGDGTVTGAVNHSSKAGRTT